MYFETSTIRNEDFVVFCHSLKRLHNPLPSGTLYDLIRGGEAWKPRISV